MHLPDAYIGASPSPWYNRLQRLSDAQAATDII